MDDKGGAAPVSRLAKLLPLFRNAILVAVLVIGAKIILRAAGLDIAPLFAGAGLLGRAIARRR